MITQSAVYAKHYFVIYASVGKSLIGYAVKNHFMHIEQFLEAAALKYS